MIVAFCRRTVGWFLQQNPGESCSSAGHAAYWDAVSTNQTIFDNGTLSTQVSLPEMVLTLGKVGLSIKQSNSKDSIDVLKNSFLFSIFIISPLITFAKLSSSRCANPFIILTQRKNARDSCCFLTFSFGTTQNLEIYSLIYHDNSFCSPF